MSMRAVGRRRPTLHLVLLVALLALPGRALGEDGVLACHTAIEAGGRTWAEASLDAIERCAHHARARFGPCVERAFREPAFGRLRRRWGKRVARACQGLSVGADLGYLASCVPATATSPCAFPSDRIDAPRPRNDLIDCLACQIGERLQDAGAALLASAPIREGCRRTLGDGGIGVLRMLLDELYGCVGLPEGASLAACLAEPGRAARIETAMASWRATSEQRCAHVDPLRTLGYPGLCAGIEPPVPPDCPDAASACDFPRTNVLSAPGSNDDLLDCLRCRVEEAALGVGRDVLGADVCCTPEGCGTVRTRAACRRAGGHPVYFRVDPVDDAVHGGSAHGVALGRDGSVFFPYAGLSIMALSPGGESRMIGSTDGGTSGLVLDDAGNIYAAVRSTHRVERIAPDGSTSVVAGTGVPGHDGDGGPAAAARTVAPAGVAVDGERNVYFTESGAMSTFLGLGTAAGEYVRMIDPSGTIHTIAGSGGFGDGGSGGPALGAQLAGPYSIDVLPDRSLLVGEVGLQRVLRLDPSGILLHVAGRAEFPGSYAGDGGPAVSARLSGVEGIGHDQDGNVFVADFRTARIRLIDRLGCIITVAGTGDPLSEYRGPGVLVDAGCPAGLAVGVDGRIIYSDTKSVRLRVLTPVRY